MLRIATSPEGRGFDARNAAHILGDQEDEEAVAEHPRQGHGYQRIGKTQLFQDDVLGHHHDLRRDHHGHDDAAEPEVCALEFQAGDRVGCQQGAAAIFAFYWIWQDFFQPLIFVSSPKNYTIPLALKLYTDPNSYNNYGGLFAMSVISLLPVIIVFIAFQKYIVEGIATDGIKG